MTDESLFRPVYYAIKNSAQNSVKTKYCFAASLNAYIKITHYDKIFVIGQTDNPAAVENSYYAEDSYAIKLPVGSLCELFHVDASELTNKIVRWNDLQSDMREEDLLEKITEHRLIVNKISRLIMQSSLSNAHSFIRSLIMRTYAKPPRAVETLSTLSGYSSRQLQRIFSATVGFSPKRFLSLLRFMKSASALEHNPTVGNVSAIAHNFRYFDQSHFIKEFTRYSGVTPGQYAMSDIYNTKKTFSGVIPL